MNRWETKRLVKKNDVIALKADKTQPAPDVDALLLELGNAGRAIPFVAIYPADGGPPKTMDGLITQEQVLEALKQAGPSANQAGEARQTALK